jgi:hypothetical protein
MGPSDEYQAESIPNPLSLVIIEYSKETPVLTRLHIKYSSAF